MISSKRASLLVISLLLCVMFFAIAVQQSYRYFQLEREITVLEEQQRELFERNKQGISSIIDNRISSTENTALKDANLTLASPDEIIYIERVITKSDKKEKKNGK